MEHLKNLKTGRVLYLGLELSSKAKSISWDSSFKGPYKDPKKCSGLAVDLGTSSIQRFTPRCEWMRGVG